nr:hypothetical protein [Tanacetum cinerariifolium]
MRWGLPAWLMYVLGSQIERLLEGGKYNGCSDITEFFRKLKFICHWVDPFKDLKWSNVSGVMLSSLSESDDTFLSLQAFSDLYYLFGGFMYYLWSRELNISNFGPADRKILPVDGSESYNRNLQAVLTNGVISCSTLFDQGYVEEFYDQ